MHTHTSTCNALTEAIHLPPLVAEPQLEVNETATENPANSSARDMALMRCSQCSPATEEQNQLGLPLNSQATSVWRPKASGEQEWPA